MRRDEFPYLPKDFIETAEGLLFAVVSYQAHEGKVGCFLRYVREDGKWQKVSTEQANTLLAQYYPQYLYHSPQFDASFHAVEVDAIKIHYRPEQRLQSSLAREHQGILEDKLNNLVTILVQYGADCHYLGLTGSMLIHQQNKQSDIDLVVYGREQFNKTRLAVQQALENKQLSGLDHGLMLENYERRSSELDFDSFSWHENRKFNKAVIDQTKFDIGMVCIDDTRVIDQGHYSKQGKKTLTAIVSNDLYAFDFPACYEIEDADTPEVWVYTHTYIGQARKGEKVIISGTVEGDIATGKRRLIVGSTREATGEYIKVLR